MSKSEEIVTIDKLVNGGQGLGALDNGKKVFAWNALPGEIVKVRIIKNKKDYMEAIAEQIIKPSTERVAPREANYLSTSPWQIINFDSENRYKKQIIEDIFAKEQVSLPNFYFLHNNNQYHYRNKMEYSFWGDESGLHLALHHRGSKGKQIVAGSQLAMPAIDEAANKILAELQKADIRAGELKTVIVRCNQDGDVVASLFVKNENFVKLSLPDGIKALTIHFSNPKSPASIITKELYMLGQNKLSDMLLGRSFEYNSDSFFQVNIPIFEEALNDIKGLVDREDVVDMYGGVGSIGLSVADKPLIIELDEITAKMAKKNAQNSGAKVICAASEKALEYINKDKVLIVDPPRAGLHKALIQKIIEVKPPKMLYLSCNPVSQARDVKLLSDQYKISFMKGYNFFPRTPHIETLIELKLV